MISKICFVRKLSMILSVILKKSMRMCERTVCFSWKQNKTKQKNVKNRKGRVCPNVEHHMHCEAKLIAPLLSAFKCRVFYIQKKEQ